MFDIQNIQEKMKESQNRWEEINKLTERLKNCSDAESNQYLKDLVILLVDHLRPLYSTKNFEKEVKEIFNILGGK